MLQAGYSVYSPIAHTHPLARFGNIDPLDHAVWLPFDDKMLAKSDTLFVANMDRWWDSHGIKYEIETFRGAEKPIYYLDRETLSVHKFQAV